MDFLLINIFFTTGVETLQSQSTGVANEGPLMMRLKAGVDVLMLRSCKLICVGRLYISFSMAET